MPHFVLECSADRVPDGLRRDALEAVRDAALASGLFDARDVKVRIRRYDDADVVTHHEIGFVHVFGYLREGRTDEQKRDLSARIVRALVALLPDAPLVSANLLEFDASYANRSMLERA
jgi:5-carboxymethyl-2-hydroxymuconate isomerase